MVNHATNRYKKLSCFEYCTCVSHFFKCMNGCAVLNCIYNKCKSTPVISRSRFFGILTLVRIIFNDSAMIASRKGFVQFIVLLFFIFILVIFKV